jgi:glycosyltransferase involved in cell wall biosynthesis
MTSDSPLVSICLPVYNGENYVSQAISSILDQTFENFELIISDNASTDGTSDICRDAAARDRRVRYYRADINRGLSWNHNRAFELARGRYLTHLGHDDVMGKEYVSQCIAALQADSRAVLSFTTPTHIDETGKVIERFPNHNPGASESPSKRFYDILGDDWCHAIYGVMKTAILRKTSLHGGFADADRVLLAEIGLRGRFALVQGHLFSRRVHAGASTQKYRNVTERTTVIFDPMKAGKVTFPRLLQASRLFSAIRRSTLPLDECLSCYCALLRWLWSEHRRHLLDELCHKGLAALRTTPKTRPAGRCAADLVCEPAGFAREGLLSPALKTY